MFTGKLEHGIECVLQLYSRRVIAANWIGNADNREK